MLRLLIITLLLPLLVACDRATEGPTLCSIAELKAMCRGRVCHIVEDISVAGTVVATDWLGEYRNSFVVADDTHGIEVAFDCRDIAAAIPLYSRVTIYCNGLALGRLGDKVVLGVPPTGDFPVDNISEDLLSRYIRLEGGAAADYRYAERRLGDISTLDIGRPVIVRDVRILDARADMRWCDSDEMGEPITTLRTLVDGQGRTLPLRTLGSCTYAAEPLPLGLFSLCAVVDSAEGSCCLRIINHSIIE